MKKILMLTLILCISFITYSCSTTKLPDLAPNEYKYVEVYSNKNIQPSQASKIATSNMYIYRYNFIESLDSILKNNNLGYCFTYSLNEISLNYILSILSSRKVKEEYIGDLYIYYGYSNKLNGGITIDGVKINIQIASNNGILKLASPIIMGSY